MAGNGGKREGAGNKSYTERWQSRTKALAALVAKYKSEEKAWLAAIDDPQLKKFVFEHAFGKPQENVNVESTEGLTVVLKKVDSGH
jgi:hypothetical protein